MKTDIHPKYDKTNIVCVCGNVIETRSTMGQQTYNVEICSSCHPFFTGKQKLVDTAGRIERFNRKYKNFKKSDSDESADSKPGGTTEAQASS